MTFEALANKITPKLKGIAYRLSGHFSVFNHEDLYQEALTRLWQDYNSGKLFDKTDSYILQGCYFHLKNYMRTQKVYRNFVSIEDKREDEDSRLGDSFLLQDENSLDFIDELHNRYLIEAIRNNGLSPQEKEVFLLLAENLTTRQIGFRLGVSHVRVVKVMAKIREKCKKHLD